MPMGRMHSSQPSNPFVSYNQQQQQQAQQSNYASQTTSLPPFNLNANITPFNPSTASAYGSGAFGASAGTSSFTPGMMAGPGQGQGLGSAAAQAGFARGAAMQEHNHQIEAGGMGMRTGAAARIREVWQHNLESEFHMLRQLIQRYSYVSMDAEFPGIVARPIGGFSGSKAEYHYQTLRCNVDILKPIQVGITLWNADGDLCPPQDPSITQRPGNKLTGYNHHVANQNIPCTWVFNFEFNLESDMAAESSIELLKASGVDFQRHMEFGVSHAAFGALLITSDLVLNPDVQWLSFHSGYDFGYLIKLLTDHKLPEGQTEFFNLVKTFFPKLWDIKFLLRHAQRQRAQGRMTEGGQRIVDSLGSKSGLSDLAEELQCQRIGQPHTAGSDAWLTGAVFWSMKANIFNSSLDDELSNQIYGLHGVPAPASQQYREEFFAAQGTPGGATTNGGMGSSNTASFTPGGQNNGGHNPSTPVAQHAGLHSGTPGAGREGGLYTAAQHNLQASGFQGFQYSK